MNLEVIAKYLNEEYEKQYMISPMLNVWEKYIQEIYGKEKWGYSIPYLLTAQYKCNPNYARYYEKQDKRTLGKLEKMLLALNNTEKIVFSAENARRKWYI